MRPSDKLQFISTISKEYDIDLTDEEREELEQYETKTEIENIIRTRAEERDSQMEDYSGLCDLWSKGWC